jgi:arabinofuranosyltransferase
MKFKINENFGKISQYLLTIRYQRVILTLLALTTSLLFVLIGFKIAQPGYPLDDAWIHQTYARNYAETGSWEYNRGEESAGSTSPLWTLLLSIGYLTNESNPYYWTIFLSILCFVFLVLIVHNLQSKITKEVLFLPLGAGLMITMDWHLLWGTASGMETILFCLITTLIFLLLKNDKPKWILVGLVTGILVWVRPDGITLAGPILVIMLFMGIRKNLKLLDIVFFIFALLVPIFFYGLLNKQISGQLLPNTFFAKQAEYVTMLKQPFLLRSVNVFSMLISGAGILLLPGFIYSIKNAFVKVDIWRLSVFCWILGFGILYVTRLPVNYQHGRYLFPLIPMYTILGLTGSSELDGSVEWEWWQRMRPKFFFLTSIIAIALIFVIVGSGAFIQDLRISNKLFVEPAIWIKQNTSESSIISAHDIGAIGYFSDRKLIDLAGLIQPEVIPFIRDETKIREYLFQQNADYLVIFKGWYPSLDYLGEIRHNFEISYQGKIESVQIHSLK